jgi:hypothetical protein
VLFAAPVVLDRVEPKVYCCIHITEKARFVGTVVMTKTIVAVKARLRRRKEEQLKGVQ